MLDILKNAFNENHLLNLHGVISIVLQLLHHFEQNIQDESARNAAIDAVIKVLESEKR